VRHVVAWLGWWLALFWLWLLLVGQWNREELAAAALAAAIAAGGAEFARSRTGFGARFPLGLLTDLPSALGMVVVDFGIVLWALLASVARRRVVRGEFVSREPERESCVSRGAGPRAWTVLLASYSPNAYVVDVDPESRLVLLHDLIPNRKSESPA
jgi:hypothetical protein